MAGGGVAPQGFHNHLGGILLDVGNLAFNQKPEIFTGHVSGWGIAAAVAHQQRGILQHGAFADQGNKLFGQISP